ncbi:MAG: hypothetical protein ACKVX9_17570 [Blastocatellia bacterium]
MTATIPSSLRLQAALSGLLALGLLLGACREANRGGQPSPANPGSGNAVPAPRISIRADIGFATPGKFLDHYQKHGHEFGSISQKEYLRRAQELRDRPATGSVLESVRRDGVITRFDTDGGAFLAFNADLTIRTYFKPNDGVNYFRRQSKR